MSKQSQMGCLLPVASLIVSLLLLRLVSATVLSDALSGTDNLNCPGSSTTTAPITPIVKRDNVANKREPNFIDVVHSRHPKSSGTMVFEYVYADATVTKHPRPTNKRRDTDEDNVQETDSDNETPDTIHSSSSGSSETGYVVTSVLAAPSITVTVADTTSTAAAAPADLSSRPTPPVITDATKIHSLPSSTAAAYPSDHLDDVTLFPHPGYHDEDIREGYTASKSDFDGDHHHALTDNESDDRQGSPGLNHTHGKKRLPPPVRRSVDLDEAH